ncbi:hypothetical protein FIM1_1844 [Kluyveromyces marxianus]|uniref:Secreted protein n=1 Tax=Kluyveromyces marxianus TaxID=4911 RepID=A0ABX6EVQ0_KLUMA|nr:hypothetical protein FIM1_1844 [Kluyveromyces marxianus]
MLLTLKSVTKFLLLTLVLNLALKLARAPLLRCVYNFLTTCPRESDVCIFWWQRWPFLEPWIWSTLDYIEARQRSQT